MTNYKSKAPKEPTREYMEKMLIGVLCDLPLARVEGGDRGDGPKRIVLDFTPDFTTRVTTNAT